MRFLPFVPVIALVLSLAVGARAQAPAGEQPPDLQAGGLRPPGSGEAASAAAPSPEGDLARADREDAGRGLEYFWIESEAGYEYLGLETFHSNDLVDPDWVKTSASGLVVGAGLGVRILFLTFGPRFRYGFFSEWDAWTLGGEVGLRVPIGNLEPHFLLGAGYATVGGFEPGPGLDSNAVRIRGFDVRLGGGLDIYLSNALSVGALITGEALFLRRAVARGLSPPTTPDPLALYRAEGSSAGFAFAGTGVIGLHF